MVYTAGGREVVINHKGSGLLNFIYRDDRSSEVWTEAEIPSAYEDVGFVWARAAVGGADGNSIHVICPTTVVALGGEIVDGQDGSIKYWRSTDQGETWDIQDFQPEGTNSDFFNRVGGDSYTIIADGDNIAYAVFNDFGDSYLMKSADNGTTWTKSIMVDFPIDNYVIDTGIDQDGDQIPDTVSNTDGGGVLMFDAAGMVHASWGNMRYLDADLSDSNFSFFPGTSGLMYWNEGLGVDGAILVADLEDMDGDDVFTFGSSNLPASYGVSMTSFPTMAKDANGKMYLVYSAAIDNLLNNAGTFNFRHLFMISSSDGGVTWTSPYDITPFDEDDEEPMIECVFPNAWPEVIDNKLSLIYHRDYNPGLVVNDEDTDDTDGIVLHLEVDLSAIVGLEDEQALESPFAIYPNPASGNTVFVRNSDASYTYTMSDILGKSLFSGRMNQGSTAIDVSGLDSGVYLLMMDNGVTRYTHTVSVR